MDPDQASTIHGPVMGARSLDACPYPTSGPYHHAPMAADALVADGHVQSIALLGSWAVRGSVPVYATSTVQPTQSVL